MLTASMMTFFLGLAGTVHAETLIGKVNSIDQAGNSITLVSEEANSSGTKDHKLVWDENLAEKMQLKNAQMGQIMTVDAEQNLITRTWKVNSVGGALAIAEKTLLSSDDRTISGEILEIDHAGNWLSLRSKGMDEKGQSVQNRVVWDTSNQSVSESLGKNKVGDNITLTASQNIITKNWKVSSVAGMIEAMAKGDIQTLAGEVRKVDNDKNFIVLFTTDLSGKTGEKTIVWDNDFKQQTKLENAKVGDHLSVRADQNMITRNWKVTSLS